jgi:hypothetical protein
MVDDNFHFGREDELYQHGVFSGAEEAIAACKRIVALSHSSGEAGYCANSLKL